MGKNKKGVELPVNLIIILVIGLFVFGAAYFGFLKPTQEGSSIFGKQMDAFKGQKFSLMDNFDSLTDKQVKDLGDKSPEAMIESKINTIETNIGDGDCNVAKETALLLQKGKVTRYEGILELTPEDQNTVQSLIQQAENCIEQGGINAINAQIDNILGLVRTGTTNGLGDCSSAKSISENLLKNGVKRGDGEQVLPDQAQKSRINTAIAGAKRCIESSEKPLTEQKEILERAKEKLDGNEWYASLLDGYDGALIGFMVNVPTIFDFKSGCSDANTKEWANLIIKTEEARSKTLGEDVYSGLSREEKEIVFNLNEQTNYFNYVCKARAGDCGVVGDDDFTSSRNFLNLGEVDLFGELLGEEITVAYNLEKSQCNKNNGEFLSSWKSFVKLKNAEADKSLYLTFREEYISMLNEEILDYKYAKMNSMKYVQEKIEEYSGDDDEELNAFRSDNIIGCPWDFSDYDADIAKNPGHCSEFNYEVISKFLGKDSTLGLNLLDNSVKPTDQLLKAVKEGLILDPVLCYWRTLGDNTCNSCKYGSYQGKLNSCREYAEQSTCELNSCGQSDPNGCKWTGSSCVEA